MLQTGPIPVARETWPNAHLSCKQVRLHAKQSFHQRARRDADRVAEVALRLLPMHIERRTQMEIPGTQAHVHRVQQAPFEDAIRVIAHSRLPHCQRHVHVFGQQQQVQRPHAYGSQSRLSQTRACTSAWARPRHAPEHVPARPDVPRTICQACRCVGTSLSMA